ncbi:hypothetical protein L7F22_019479 [Adiantum nelumboides]|nr:hypothetical protein [Adiantum nelumboides]
MSLPINWSSPSTYLHRPIFVAGIVAGILMLATFAALLFLFFWITISRSPSTTSKASLGRSAAVVVLGDIGRSPRMCFHAQSLAEDGWRVAMIGYKGTPPPPPLRRSSVKLHYVFQPFAKLINILPKRGGAFALLTTPLKVIGQSFGLFWILATQVRPPPELIIVQTPPALPSLFIVRLVGMLLGSRLIIDWHNLGYSILALKFAPTSLIVRTYCALEKWCGRRAFAHLCVTRALRKHLQETWKVKGPISVLYDRPPSHYRRATVFESHNLISRLMPSISPPIHPEWYRQQSVNTDAKLFESPFTRGDNSYAEWRDDRPALVVSSTSWTEDEDFGMLLRAASLYEKRARLLNRESGGRKNYRDSPTLLESPMLDSHGLAMGWSGGNIESKRDKSRRASLSVDNLPKATRLPKMLLIVTGKGELRDYYVREIERLEREEEWQYVRIRTAWLQVEDYPTLLGSADVGVSLHSSSSGMDLPMKVVDMLGCGLTVCTLGFPCVNELVQQGNNGLVFYSDKELAAQLESLLAQHPEPNWLAHRTQPMISLFPEDIPRSPPISSSSSPVIGFGADASRSSSPPPINEYTAHPSSPLPFFTLLQSPMQSNVDLPQEQVTNGDSYGEGEGYAQYDLAKTRNWSGNWKRVVRPLIMKADLEDERESRRGLTSNSNRAIKATPPNRLSKNTTPRSSFELLDKLNGAEATAGDAQEHAGDLRRRKLQYEEESRYGQNLSPEPSPPKPLYSSHRRSSGDVIGNHTNLAALQDPIEIRAGSKIPGIHISAPTS